MTPVATAAPTVILIWCVGDGPEEEKEKEDEEEEEVEVIWRKFSDLREISRVKKTADSNVC